MSASKRATIYLDPALYRALELKSAETDATISEIVNAAVRDALAEDADDLAAIAARREEPARSFSDAGAVATADLIEHESHDARGHAVPRESAVASFLHAPGRPGAFGALMDEYARSAEDFCRVVEADDAARFVAERAGTGDLRSRRDVCAHVVASARLYADLVRKVRGMEHADGYREEAWIAGAPGDVRALLAATLRYTEDAVEGLDALAEAEVQALVIRSPWTSRYDPESILEHAIVHVLRHRRQLERWAS